MPFHDILQAESVRIDKTARSKTAVFLRISQLLSQLHPPLQVEGLFNAFWEREQLGSTTIGCGILVPHIHLDKLSKTCGCLLKLQHPVDFDAEDKQPVDLVLALLVPSSETTHHLQTLSNIVSYFSIPSFRESCREVSNNAALYSLLVHEIPLSNLMPLEPA